MLNIFGDITLIAFIIPKLCTSTFSSQYHPANQFHTATLKIGRRQRNILIGVMGMGVLVIIAAIVRLIRTIDELKSANNPGYDLPFASYDVMIWSSVELNMGLVCAAAPATRPLVRLLAPRLLPNESGGQLDNSAARRSNYADGTLESENSQPGDERFELGGWLKSGTGKSVSDQGYGNAELWDCGGLLKNETCVAVEGRRIDSDRGDGRDHNY
jgi:hypothetical protein